MQDQKPSENPPPKVEDQVDKESNRSYYYDDAHGYQEFDPDKDDGENEDQEELGFRSVDADLNVAPFSLVEPDHA